MASFITEKHRIPHIIQYNHKVNKKISSQSIEKDKLYRCSALNSVIANRHDFRFPLEC